MVPSGLLLTTCMGWILHPTVHVAIHLVLQQLQRSAHGRKCRGDRVPSTLESSFSPRGSIQVTIWMAFLSSWMNLQVNPKTSSNKRDITLLQMEEDRVPSDAESWEIEWGVVDRGTIQSWERGDTTAHAIDAP